MASKAIHILDNCEYCANWGRLARSSGKPSLIPAYRGVLRDSSWRTFLFEQPEGREGHCIEDNVGWESPNRWITGILWKNDHILSELMITQLGFPLVNLQGIDNVDITSLDDRCPFDWGNMKWLVEEFPESLDLKLERDFE